MLVMKWVNNSALQPVLAKTRAEIQKAYREWKKAKGSTYLNNELKRVKRVQKYLWWSWLDGKENGGRSGSQQSKQAKSKSKMLSTSTTGQERMKTAVWWATDFIQKKSTLKQASSLKENTRMSEPFQTLWKFTLLPAFQRSKFKWKKRLATVTNAWRVRSSKEVQHVVGKQSLSVSYRFSCRPTWYSCQRLSCCRLWRYIGQVQQIEEQDGEVEVSFMTKGKGKVAESSFKWPAPKDVLLVVGKKEYSLCWGSRSCR